MRIKFPFDVHQTGPDTVEISESRDGQPLLIMTPHKKLLAVVQEADLDRIYDEALTKLVQASVKIETH